MLTLSFFKKQQKLLLISFKIILLFFLIWSILTQVTRYENLQELWSNYVKSRPSRTNFGVSIVCLLAVFNWGIEAIKWQLALSALVHITYFQSYKSVLAGISLAFFTPNRVGEYGGRVWLLSPTTPKTQAVLCLLQSNIAQLIANLSAGYIGFSVFWYLYKPFSGAYLALIFIGLTVYLGFITTFYFNNSVLKKIIPNRWEPRIESHLNVNIQPSMSVKYAIVGFSLLRYTIYLAQYGLLLWASGIQLPLNQLLIFSLSAFFVQTILPTITLLELGIKGNIALYFFGQADVNPISVLSATFLLWGINLLVPSIAGAWVWLLKK